MALGFVPLLARLAHAASSAFVETSLGRRWSVERYYRQEYATVMRELGSYTDHELASDLRLGRSDIPWIASRKPSAASTCSLSGIPSSAPLGTITATPASLSAEERLREATRLRSCPGLPSSRRMPAQA